MGMAVSRARRFRPGAVRNNGPRAELRQAASSGSWWTTTSSSAASKRLPDPLSAASTRRYTSCPAKALRSTVTVVHCPFATADDTPFSASRGQGDERRPYRGHTTVDIVRSHRRSGKPAGDKAVGSAPDRAQLRGPEGMDVGSGFTRSHTPVVGVSEPVSSRNWPRSVSKSSRNTGAECQKQGAVDREPLVQRRGGLIALRPW